MDGRHSNENLRTRFRAIPLLVCLLLLGATGVVHGQDPDAPPAWPTGHHAVPLSATGWTAPASVKADNANAATTTADEAVLTLTGFAAGQTGTIHSASLFVRGEDPTGGNSDLDVAATSSGCSNLQTSTTALVFASKQIHRIDLTCPDGLTWETIAGTTVGFTSHTSGGLLGIGASGSWRMEHAWIDVQFTNQAPALEIDAPTTANEGQLVVIGVQTTDPEDDPITINIRQTLGPEVTLDSTDNITTFTAPVISARTAELRFVFEIHDSYGNKATENLAMTIFDSSVAEAPDASTGPVDDPLVPEGSTPVIATLDGTLDAALAKCVVDIPASSDDASVPVVFPPECGLDVILMQWTESHGDIRLELHRTTAVPAGLPDGDWQKSVVVYQMQAVNGPTPDSATYRLKVDSQTQRDLCVEADCIPQMYTYVGGDWEKAETIVRGEEVVASLASPSYMALGGATVVSGGSTTFPWTIILIGAAVVLGTGGTAGFLLRKRLGGGGREKISTFMVEAPASAEQLKQELKNEELVQFLNNASHDLASPLTPIRLQLHMLTQLNTDEMTDKQRHALEVVSRNVEQMGLLVTDLKEASRLQAGKLELFPEALDAGKVAKHAVESFLAPAAEQNVTLEFKGPKTPLKVQGDPGRLNQVIYNLLTNAIKFTPEGGTVTVRAGKKGANVQISVSDSGIGLTKEDINNLFQPFSQVHGAKEKKKGSGLGLYICKGIVKGHKGKIWIESDGPGKGTTFLFTIPLEA